MLIVMSNWIILCDLEDYQLVINSNKIPVSLQRHLKFVNNLNCMQSKVHFLTICSPQ